MTGTPGGVSTGVAVVCLGTARLAGGGWRGGVRRQAGGWCAAGRSAGGRAGQAWPGDRTERADRWLDAPGTAGDGRPAECRARMWPEWWSWAAGTGAGASLGDSSGAARSSRGRPGVTRCCGGCGWPAGSDEASGAARAGRVFATAPGLRAAAWWRHRSSAWTRHARALRAAARHDPPDAVVRGHPRGCAARRAGQGRQGGRATSGWSSLARPAAAARIALRGTREEAVAAVEETVTAGRRVARSGTGEGGPGRRGRGVVRGSRARGPSGRDPSVGRPSGAARRPWLRRAGFWRHSWLPPGDLPTGGLR
ncbi:hypothetical protein STENM223S_06129 [Streptomyces tendae]